MQEAMQQFTGKLERASQSDLESEQSVNRRQCCMSEILQLCHVRSWSWIQTSMFNLYSGFHSRRIGKFIHNLIFIRLIKSWHAFLPCGPDCFLRDSLSVYSHSQSLFLSSHISVVLTSHLRILPWAGISCFTHFYSYSLLLYSLCSSEILFTIFL